jgi:hypothetical protein
MLYSDQERAVMAGAVQPNMRATNIGVQPFKNIIADYLAESRLKDARILDIGPGQLDFLDLMRKGGASRTVGIDFDPAIQALGTLRGHEVILADLRTGWPLKGEVFDGIFCRGSLNCFWFPKEERLRGFLDDMMASLSTSAWMWIAPWSKPAPGREDYTETVDRIVAEWAQRNGVTVEEPKEANRTRYGIGYVIPKVEIWRRT